MNVRTSDSARHHTLNMSVQIDGFSFYIYSLRMLDAQIDTRCTKKELAAWTKCAKKDGVTRSEWIRELLNEEAKANGFLQEE